MPRNKASAARVVSAGMGGAQERQPPVITTPPADFADAERLEALKDYGRIVAKGIDTPLTLHLRAAVVEFETLAWRALLRQTREQVFPPLRHGTEPHYGPTSLGLDTGERRRRRPTALDEPFVTAEAFELDRDGAERAVAITASRPAHGELWADWTGAAVSRRVSYTAGWADADAVPDDVKAAIYAIAAANWGRDPAAAEPARMMIRERYARRRREAQVAVGIMEDDGVGEWW